MAETAARSIYTEVASNKRRSFFFILGFFIFVLFVGWVFGMALQDAYMGVGVAFIIAGVSSWFTYYYSDSMVLMISGAVEIQKSDNPDLYRLVENLCIGAGLPQPKIFIIDDTAPNAFATGRDPQHAVIAVTKGLLMKLEKPELEGVLAHELSHIGNYDIRLMSIVAIMAGTVVLLSDLFLRWTWWGGGRRSSDNDREGGQLQMIIFVAAIVLALLSPLIATIIKLAISRKRELLADADAALLTRYPEGLARALEKLTADTEPLEAANKATAHLYIVNPLKGHEDNARSWFSGLFDTHPPIDERIKLLRSM